MKVVSAEVPIHALIRTKEIDERLNDAEMLLLISVTDWLLFNKVFLKISSFSIKGSLSKTSPV